jgi:ankyrin repeat protein
MFGHTEMVRFLIENRADVHCKDRVGCTALHVACYYGYLEAAFVLMDHGAEVLAKDKHGKTAIDLANNKDLAEKLSHKFLTSKNAPPAAAVIQDKLKVLIHSGK